MRWVAVRRFTLLAAIVTGLWWALLLPAWVETSGAQVAGTEINRTVVLIPGIALLLALISLYGKLSRSLLTGAALAVLGTSIWIITADFGTAPKVIELQEQASGVLGGTGEYSIGVMPWIFAGVGIALSVLYILAALARREKRSTVDSKPTDSEDPRFIWDEQSN